MSGLAFLAIAAKVRSALPDVTAEQSENGQPFLRAPAAALPALAALLRHDRELQFDSLMDLTGYDRLKYPATPPSDAIAVVYLLFSMALRHRVMVEVQAPRALCTVPSVSGVWPAAIYFEREVFDLLGVQFAGHPSLHRILCPDDWVGHALRKDYLYPTEYRGVPHLRDGQHFEEGPRRVGDPEPQKAPAKGGHA
ncbi:MAG: NADH-quinone oxidoreductase subunit C [Planctomycetota bacterium]|nr:NADH-quinone oxidoreductase subunit C [Planctomycetota bacterium]